MDTRVDPAWADGERSLLIAFLQYHRDTMAMKCEGLTPDQLVQRSVPPSSMSLIGLVRHLADVERSWFRRVMAGEGNDTAGPIFFVPDVNDDGEFDDVAAENVDADFAVWRAEMAAADEIIARTDLDTTGHRVRDDARPSLRWVLVHLIEEYARHNGHADLLRERIDGATGE